MARGFDSKSVEEQQLEAQRPATKSESGTLSAEEKQKRRDRENLQLAVKKLEADLARTTNPQYRTMLERALEDLKAKLG